MSIYLPLVSGGQSALKTKLAVHWIPVHGRPTDLEYMRRLQPRSVKIVDPDVQHIVDVYKVCPKTLIVLRDWALSEQKNDMKQESRETGIRHALRWREKLGEWRRQSEERGLTFPPDSQLLVVGINEPPVWEALQQTVDYTVAFLHELMVLGLRGGALNLSVGWPANTGEDTPPDWKPYAPVEDAIERGNHILVLHEYWSDKGPAHMWGWWAGRYQKCPWAVPILFGECGLDQYVESTGHGKKRGWQSWLSADAYRSQLADYDAELLRDPRIHSAQIFTTDGNSQDWADFDTEPAHGDILAYALSVKDKPEPKPEPQPELPPVNDSNFLRSVEWVLRWEGIWSDDPNDLGGPTHWGISQAANPDVDVANLTRDDAIQIYYERYWLPSLAHQLSWPDCLINFDSAVLYGVGQALKWHHSAVDTWHFLASRIEYTTRIRQSDPAYADRYWRGWMRRVADLMKEMTNDS